MGRSRPQEEEPSSSVDEEVALVVAGILLETITVPNPTLAIAEALVNLVPSFLPIELRADISAEVARLVLADPPEAPGGSQLASEAVRENIKYRVAYGFEAIKRLVKAVAKPSEVPVQERLAAALEAEGRYLEAHRNASKRRLEVSKLLDQAVAVYGPVLSWHAKERDTSRLNHLDADGCNFDTTNGIPNKTGAWPSVLPNCLCTFGAPIPGAEVLS